MKGDTERGNRWRERRARETQIEERDEERHREERDGERGVRESMSEHGLTWLNSSSGRA